MLNSKIEWTHHTLNFWVGCTRVSQGCANCYMETWAKRAGRDPWTVQRTAHSTWAAAKRFKAGDRVFVCSLSDFFHPDADPWRMDAWDVISKHPDVNWLILTKRPERILECLPTVNPEAPHAWKFSPWPWPNVWLGVTAENQEQADRRIPILLQIPAAVHFVSIEPMLGEIDLEIGGWSFFRPLIPPPGNKRGWPHGLDWVICGGESGSKARPMHPGWARSLRDQCVAAGVPYFFKQFGEWVDEFHPASESVPVDKLSGVFVEMADNGLDYSGVYMARVGKKKAGRQLDGRTWDQMPEVDR